MTEHKSFKRLVRARMEKTGESYTAARAMLLAADEPGKAAPGHWGAAERRHGEIARWLGEEHAVDGRSAQAITVSFERARNLRAVGQHADGFAVSASKTVAVPVERLYEAFVDESLRRRWLPGGGLRERTARRARSARFDWGEGTTRVNFGFTAKGEARSTVALAHERLADAEEAERMKAFWRERVAALKEELEP